VRQRQPVALLVSCLLVALGPSVASADPGASSARQGGPAGPEVSPAVHRDVSPPLRDIPVSPRARQLTERPLLRLPGGTSSIVGAAPDPVLQTSPGTLAATSSGLNIAGVGNGDYGFTPNAAPPDTNGAVGATQYVQWVNESFAVFNKVDGSLAFGPAAGNTLWKGFGGGCQTNNDGDPIVQYDKIANRWVMTQFSVSTTPYLQCVAVSTTSDATGTYNRYSFSYGTVQFNDYPKLGVWPDAYYVSFNIFNNGSTFAGSKACAYDRASMLAGAPATQVCFQLSSSFGGLLPSDLDGASASLQSGGVARPPAGSPNYFLNFGSNSLNLWKFHVDFATPANSTFTGPTSMPVAAFTPACNGGTCIPQPSTRQQLDSLADRLMYRLAYRHFADGHESLVVNHSVTAGSSVGVRWYEIRSPNATPTVFQQGTYAPDATYRWMGSIAMDQRGDIALGYSASSGTVLPSIRYTGRLASDTPNLMQAENTIKAGAGSQLRNLSRWGDYSAMTIDPVDDCTFWYTNEYLKSSGTFNWSTRIASFSFPSCFGLAAAPTVSSIAPTSGPAAGGTAVTISGTGFAAGATVTLGGSAATSVVVGSATSITATTPGHAAGAVTVTVTNTDAQSGSCAGCFTYTAAPSVSSIAPTAGPLAGGTVVAITGTGFSTTPGATTVAFGASAATGVACATTTSCSATSPAHAAGTVDVRVTVGAQTSATSAADQFTYTAAAPTISASPSTIAAGGTLTATWSGIPSPTSLDWIALSVQGSGSTSYVIWQRTTGSASGSVPFSVPSSTVAGTYELRLFSNDTFTLLATSGPITVTAP
jgi:IPT/TIG domain